MKRLIALAGIIASLFFATPANATTVVFWSTNVTNDNIGDHSSGLLDLAVNGSGGVRWVSWTWSCPQGSENAQIQDSAVHYWSNVGGVWTEQTVIQRFNTSILNYNTAEVDFNTYTVYRYTVDFGYTGNTSGACTVHLNVNNVG